MKAMSKSELADAAGVSVKVLMNWCKPYRKEFEVMGLFSLAGFIVPCPLYCALPALMRKRVFRMSYLCIVGGSVYGI